MAADTSYDTPSPELQKKYRFLNAFLVVILAILTIKKTLLVITIGSLHFYNLAGLIVPVINVYFIRLILQYRKTGYQFLFILSILALFYPENRQPIEFGLHLLMIVMSAHLYFAMFSRPKVSGSPR
jgi:hypothetical protein